MDHVVIVSCFAHWRQAAEIHSLARDQCTLVFGGMLHSALRLFCVWGNRNISDYSTQQYGLEVRVITSAPSRQSCGWYVPILYQWRCELTTIRYGAIATAAIILTAVFGTKKKVRGLFVSQGIHPTVWYSRGGPVLH